ncbi:unnamed protein product, partial [marine sediment metagenome]
RGGFYVLLFYVITIGAEAQREVFQVTMQLDNYRKE